MTQSSTPIKLPGFDREMTSIVREAEALGWTGRVSTLGHAIMRAPDGETTMSVTPKLGSPRNRANNRTKLERWKRERAQQLSVPAAVVDTADFEVVAGPDGLFHCPAAGCVFARPTYRQVRVHWAHKHTPRVPCPIPGCNKTTSAAQSTTHLASHYREPVSVHQLRKDLTRTRQALAEALEAAAVYQQLAQEAQDELATLRKDLRN